TSTKPGVTSSPSASTTRAASPSSRPIAAIAPSTTATSAVRAGAPVPSTTVPPRIRRSNIEAIERTRVQPVERLALPVGEVVVVLAQLVDHTGVLRVVVGEVRRPDEAVDPADLGERSRRALTGIEADPALT